MEIVGIEEMLEFYSMAPLTCMSVTTDHISSETVTNRTVENVARLIFPVKGIGDIKIEGTNYRLKKGRILHVGPDFPIQNMAVRDTKLEYVVIYFQLFDGHVKFPLYNSHFVLQVGEHMKLMNMVQQLVEMSHKGSHLSLIQSKALFLNI